MKQKALNGKVIRAGNAERGCLGLKAVLLSVRMKCIREPAR